MAAEHGPRDLDDAAHAYMADGPERDPREWAPQESADVVEVDEQYREVES